MPSITSQDQSVLKQNFRLGEENVTIGRHPGCGIQIDDGAVSRRHAEILYRDDSYYLQDLKSRNGTFLNNQLIHQATKLYDGSEIKICDVIFRFNLGNEGAVIDRPISPFSSQPPTAESGVHSVILEDNPISNVSCQLAPSSHRSNIHGHVSAEDKLRTLIKVAQTLSESLERDEILAKILDVLFELFTQADRGFIILKTESGKLQPLGVKTRRPNDEQISISRTIANQVMETKCPIISSDATEDKRFDAAVSIFDFRIRSLMCAPLINNRDESIGVIQLDTLRQSIAFSDEDLETLATIAMQASFAIQKSDLFEETKRAREIKSDLKLAHELQQRFLPQSSPKIPDYSFSSFYRPMQQVGGDFFDYIELDDDHVAVIIADVVGHGIAAAMLMAKVSAESRFALATTKSAAAAVQKLNDKLSGLNLDRFVTLVLCLLNKRHHTVEVVNAGHMPPIFRNQETGEFTELAISDSGLPVGIAQGFQYESKTVQLGQGDVMILYTDGINEAMNSAGQQLTTAAMIADVKTSQAKSPETIRKVICESVERHIGLQPPIDDMCLLTLGRCL